MDDAGFKRIMPHDTAAEQSVVGSMIVDREAIELAGEILIKEDFYEKQYGIVFQAMVELNNAGQPVDIVTLQNHLRESGVPDDISSLDFLRNIMELSITPTNVRQYSEIVKEQALLRRLIRVSDEIAGDCYSHKRPINEIFEDTEKKIFDIVQRRNTGDFVPVNRVVESVIRRIQAVMMSGNRITGIPTGFADIDGVLSGLQPSDLILIARPSMGKTAFALNIAQYAAVRNDNCTAVFSLEMSKEQLVNRLIAMDATVDAQKLRNASLEDTEIEYVMESAVRLGESRLIIDDTSGISVSELRTKCRKYKIEHDLKLVIIDYLQLMSAGGRNDSRQQEISEISRGLKSLAREINVPVVALSQLSRAVEKREDHRPMLSDLRESGAIEQDADVVMFLYREDYYNKDTERKNIAEVIIAKQRNGPIGTKELVWSPQYTKFRNMEN